MRLSAQCSVQPSFHKWQILVCVWGGVFTLILSSIIVGAKCLLILPWAPRGKALLGPPKGKEEEKHSPLSNHKNSSCSQDLRLPQALDKPIMKPPIPYIHPSIPRAGGS